eukprot:UN07563
MIKITIGSNAQLQRRSSPAITGDVTTWDHRTATTPSPDKDGRRGLHVEVEQLPLKWHQARRRTKPAWLHKAALRPERS